MARKSLLILIVLLSLKEAAAQSTISSDANNTASKVFGSLNELLEYTSINSITLQNNSIKLDQAKKSKLAAIIGTIDVTGNLLSNQFTNNTRLPVNIFPAEIFGGTPGTFQEVQTGVQYNTNVTNYADIKIINPVGWSNLKLAKINIDLSTSNNQISLKNLQENIANNYYNIINVLEQLESTKQNLAVADTLYQITKNKFNEGLLNKQTLNDSKINYLNTKENIHQLDYLLIQYYLSLKLLCDIPEEENIKIKRIESAKDSLTTENVELNKLALNNSLLQEKYALTNLKNAKAAFLPTLSLQLSNSNNLYNSEFDPLSGNWINSNYIGVKMTLPIPSSQNISKKFNAKFDYKLAKNNSEQERIQANLDQKSLENDYEKALSQYKNNIEIISLAKESFYKNQNLYEEGVINLETVLNSYTDMVSAQFNFIISEVNVQLAKSKININNNIR